METTTDLGHWEFSRSLGDINERLGFVYCIRNKLDGRRYFGRKQFWNKRGKSWIDSGWRDYCGSSEWLLADIDEHSISNFSFEILAVFDRKSGISVGEATLILCSGCLLAPERFYNRAAPAVRGKISLTDSDSKELEALKQWIQANT